MRALITFSLLTGLCFSSQASADTVYVRDTLYVPLRGGQSQEHRILHRGLRSGSVSRVLPLAWLAPDISTAILEARQPSHLTAKTLRRLPDLPLEWEKQRRILGFPRR